MSAAFSVQLIEDYPVIGQSLVRTLTGQRLVAGIKCVS